MVVRPFYYYPMPNVTINLRDYSDSLFTQVYYAVQAAVTRYVVVYGGAGSSKSYSVHQNELINLIGEGPGDTLVIRKYAADLRESCYKLFCQIIDKLNVSTLFTRAFSADNRRITYIPTGKNIVFRGIDDAEKLKSIVGIKRIVVEEANQLEFADFLELNRRARGMEDIQIILILNPVSENHWIKTQLIDGPYANQTTALRFTYADNHDHTGHSFLTPTDIAELERLKHINENQYRIYVLAEWGIDNTEGKFCWAFNRSQIAETEYDGENGLWASFDFNVNPLTCTVAQVYPLEKTIHAIECIKLEHSDIWKMCSRLTTNYPDVLWYVTGDATGRNRTAMAHDNTNYYKIIAEEMNLGTQQIQVPTTNPAIDDNRVVVNAVHKNWTVQIDPDNCKPLIYDLTYVEVAHDGSIIKNRNNASRYADFLDTWRYLINAAVKPHFDYWKR